MSKTAPGAEAQRNRPSAAVRTSPKTQTRFARLGSALRALIQKRIADAQRMERARLEVDHTRPTGRPVMAQTGGPNVRDRPTQASARNDGSRGAVLVALAHVQPRNVDWLWDQRIPRGKLSLLVGDPGLGKSWLVLDLAARLSRGAPWPDATRSRLGNVVLLTAEDGLADTVVPRLSAMGADLTRITALTAIREGGRERPLSLERDLGKFEEALMKTDAALGVFDPLSAYMGRDGDWHVDADVRAVLAPLAKLAEDRNVAVLGVLHLNKGQHQQALYRVTGSLAFVAAARTVLAVTVSPEEPSSSRRFFVPVKTNLGPKPPTLAFAITDGQIIWEAQPVPSVDLEAALRTGGRDEHETLVDAAVNTLREILAEGPESTAVVEATAREQGISKRTLERARLKAGVRAIAIRRPGTPGIAEWQLALPGALPRQDRQPMGSRRGGGLDGLTALPTGDDPLEPDPMFRAALEVFGGRGLDA